MATAGPTITSAVRHTSDPTILVVTYTVPVSGVTRVQLWEKPPTGNPVRIVDTTTLTGTISVNSRYAANVPVSLHMTLTHTTEGPSNAGSSVNVPAFTVATPTLVSASRASATQALLTYSGLTVGFNARGYVYRSAPGGNPVQVDAFDITVSSGSRNAPAPSGTAAYEYEIRVGQHGVLSDASARRSVEKWYQAPPAPTSFNVTRNASTGVVTGTFGAPSVTSRNRWTGIRVFRALKGRPLAAWRTLAAGARSFTDSTTVLSSAYDYGIESYNETGPSSSRPTASTDPVRELPNAASGLVLTYLSGNQYKLDWTTNATTERPITNQRILARVPGQTATTVLATASGSVTTHAVTLPANRIYELAILTTNSVGSAASTSNWEGPAVSTPLVPVSVSSRWLDAGTVRVSWPARSTIADAIDIEFSTQVVPDRANPAHWLTGASVSSSATSWDQVGASQLAPHTYRIRTRHTGSGRTSAWVYSATLEGQAAPLAPTLLRPVSLDATSLVRLAMTHNSIDGTPQTMGEFRYRAQGTSTWTVQSVGSSYWYNIQPNTFTNGIWLEVQGRTAAGSGVFGVWSDTLLVPLRARPTVTITGPGPAHSNLDWEAQTVTVTWESSEQVSATIRIHGMDRDDTITLGPDARSQSFDGLLDGGVYWIDLTIRDAWQSSVLAPLVLRVAYNLPAPPLLTAEQAEAASVLLQATPISDLDVLRYNFTEQFSQWTPLSGGSVGTATLTVDGQTINTVTLDGGATTAESNYNSAFYVVGGFMAYSEVEVLLEVARYEGEFATGNSVVRTIPAGVPTPVRFLASTGGTDHTWRIHAYSPVHIWDQVLITYPPGASAGDESYFDAATAREGYVYGRMPGGEFYEAVVADGAPANPLPGAPTVRIEIWCSDTGRPGSYRLCGATGTGWDYHDEHPRIGVPLWYVARAVAASGAWAESVPVQIAVDSRDTYVHFGDGHGSYVTAGRLVDALTIDGGGLDMESIQYEGHEGWTHHVSDIPLAESISVDLQLLPARGASSLQDWAQALRHTDIIYREPGGIIMQGAPSMGPRRPSSKFVQRLSLTIAGTML